MTKKQQQKNKGFTMVEMIIAVFIFTVSLSVLMAISARGLKAANQSQKQVIGDYLAIEGIEVVRNLRDVAFLRGNNNTWENIFDQDGCLSDGGPCSFIFSSNEVKLSPCTTCTIYFHSVTSTYGHDNSGGVDSGYTRNIQLTPSTTNPDELSVTVTVAWDDQEVVYTENLFLWFNNN